jgi:hypothetical protein
MSSNKSDLPQDELVSVKEVAKNRMGKKTSKENTWQSNRASRQRQNQPGSLRALTPTLESLLQQLGLLLPITVIIDVPTLPPKWAEQAEQPPERPPQAPLHNIATPILPRLCIVLWAC